MTDTWHVYILRCADGTLYTGAAKNAYSRLAVHNAGKGAKYTRSRLPVELIYWEQRDGRGEALRREAQIKRMSRSAKLLVVRGEDLSRSG